MTEHYETILKRHCVVVAIKVPNAKKELKAGLTNPAQA